MSIKSLVDDFRNGIKFIFGKPEKGQGDRKLAKMSHIVMGQIPIYGKDAVRLQMIKAIESDLKRAVRKNNTETILDNALSTPEYMLLLHKVGLDESHLRVMAMEANKKYA